MDGDRELLNDTPMAWVWLGGVALFLVCLVGSIPFRLASGDREGALMAATLWVLPVAMVLAADRVHVVKVERVGEVLRCRYLLHVAQVPLAEVQSVRWSWVQWATLVECKDRTLRLQGPQGHDQRVRKLVSWQPRIEVQ